MELSKLARAMVTEYGMSDLGPVQYEQPNGSVFLGRDYLKDKNFSDQVALEIDRETRRIIEECYAKAKSVILENLDLLKRIAYYLLQIETLTKSEIDEINETGIISWYEEKRAKEASEAPKIEEKNEDINETASKDENNSNKSSDVDLSMGATDYTNTENKDE